MTDGFLDLPETTPEGWFSLPVGSVGGCVVAARVMEHVEADFHVHEHADEMFVVLKGDCFWSWKRKPSNLSPGRVIPSEKVPDTAPRPTNGWKC